VHFRFGIPCGLKFATSQFQESDVIRKGEEEALCDNMCVPHCDSPPLIEGHRELTTINSFVGLPIDLRASIARGVRRAEATHCKFMSSVDRDQVFNLGKAFDNDSLACRSVCFSSGEVGNSEFMAAVENELHDTTTDHALKTFRLCTETLRRLQRSAAAQCNKCSTRQGPLIEVPWFDISNELEFASLRNDYFHSRAMSGYRLILKNLRLLRLSAERNRALSYGTKGEGHGLRNSLVFLYLSACFIFIAVVWAKAHTLFQLKKKQ
jgi:hypothetical protein